MRATFHRVRELSCGRLNLRNEGEATWAEIFAGLMKKDVAIDDFGSSMSGKDTLLNTL